ncbi:MAG: hypothetical protein IJK45_03270 [Bacteroidaceae bacterium]|nr:hypothetical protein [Bacteroidaceae bacterium]
MEKSDITLKADDVPKKYAVCYNHECPRAGECLHHLCYTVLPKGEDVRLCVLPQAWQGNECRQFAKAQPVRLAWGMSRLFHDVPKWQATVIRHELMQLFSSERTYFRYRRGEFLITPEIQSRVADIFRKYGYTAERQYDQTKLAYYFDVPGFGSYHAYTSKRTNKKLREHQ